VRTKLVKQALAAAVKAKGIPKLDCYGFSPSAPSIPAFTVGAVVIEPNQTFRGARNADFTCTLLTSIADDESGQALLDDLLDDGGDYSVVQALLDARGEPGEMALGGLADDLMIVRIDAYRMITWTAGEAGSTYYGADITVRVIGS
jgi:hypothetical protein